MKRKKNMLLSSGVVGLTAVALAMSPAMAETEINDSETTKNQIVEKVEKLGAEVNLDKEKLTALGLPSGGFKVVIEAKEVQPSDAGGDEIINKENIKVEEVFDDADVKKGEKTTLTVAEQGVWTFLTDVEGTLVSVDFKPAEGFTGDPVVKYAVNSTDEDEKKETVEGVADLAERPVLELKEIAVEDSETVLNDNAEASDSVFGEIVLDYPNDTVQKAPVEKAENADEAVTEETAKGEVKEPENVQENTIMLARGMAAPAAPAAPTEQSFSIPNLTVDNASATGPVSIKFGEHGDKLASDIDAGTLTFIANDDNETVMMSGKELQQPLNGEWRVDGTDGFVFEAYESLSDASVTARYTVRNQNGEAGSQGTITINFGAKANPEEVPDSDDSSNPGVAPDVETDPDTTVSVDENGNTVNEDGTVVDENGNPVENTNGETGTTDENGSDRPGSIETGAMVSDNNSAIYGIAAAIAGALGAAFLFLSRKPVRNEDN